MKKSTNGTTCTKDWGLLSREISDIIKTAGKAGVSVLKYGALEVQFFPQVSQGPESLATTIKNFEDFSESAVKLTEEERREFEEVEQLLSDPSIHEETMIEEALQRAN
jgi:hypothetical protein